MFIFDTMTFRSAMGTQELCKSKKGPVPFFICSTKRAAFRYSAAADNF